MTYSAFPLLAFTSGIRSEASFLSKACAPALILLMNLQST